MDFGNFTASSFVRIKLVTFMHIILIVFALQGHWMPPAFLFYNILFIISLFWSIQCNASIDAIHTAALINAISIIFDLMCVVMFFPRMEGWSATFAIINLVARPFSLMLLHRELVERGGNFMGDASLPTTSQRSYEDIDRPNQSVPTMVQSDSSRNII